MPRKITIAREALRQLDFIHKLITEDRSGTSFHSNSANNYMQSIRAGGLELPAWIERNAGYLKANGWRWQ